MLNTRIVRNSVAAVALAVASLSAQAGTITALSWDFETNFNGTLAPGVTIGGSFSTADGSGLVSSQGFNGVGGFSGNFYRGANLAPGIGTGMNITLFNLPAHTAVDLNLLMAFVDSWDSNNGSPAPDYFNLAVDGTTILQSTCNNAGGSSCYSGSVVAPMAHRGFNGSWQDIGFDLSGVPALSFAHTASTITIQFFASGGGWQGGDDESFAIDNLEVVLTTVDAEPTPEPVSLALLGLGLCGMGLSRRARK